MVEIHLYGDLRKYSNGSVPAGDTTLILDPDPDETLDSLLARAGIPDIEMNYIFFNSKLLVSRSQTAPLYGLPQVDSNVSEWNLTISVVHGDRIGLFGLDIPILGM